MTFVIFNRDVLCQDIGRMSWNFGRIIFLISYQLNITKRKQFSETKNSAHPSIYRFGANVVLECVLIYAMVEFAEIFFIACVKFLDKC